MGGGSSALAPDNYQWLTLWRDAKLPTASLRVETKAVSLSLSVAFSLSVSLSLCLSFSLAACFVSAPV